MAHDQVLAERIRALVAGRAGMSEKRMFGGVCFMLNGNMACGTADERLMLRVGAERHEATLALPHVVPMDFTGRPLRGYVFVQPAGFRSDVALRKWVELALQFVASLPAKSAKPAKPAAKAKRKPKALPPKLRALAERAKAKTARP
jgi:TfoX/Sxy family transcriptional regulator of competence genes